METHDRIVGKIWRDAKRICDASVTDARGALQNTLRSFKSLGVALLEAKEDGTQLDRAIASVCGWNDLEDLVAIASQLTYTMSSDPLNHVAQG